MEEQAREGMEEGAGEEEEYPEKIRDQGPGGTRGQEGPGGARGREGPGGTEGQEGTRGVRAVRRGGTRAQPVRRWPRAGGGEVPVEGAPGRGGGEVWRRRGAGRWCWSGPAPCWRGRSGSWRWPGGGKLRGRRRLAALQRREQELEGEGVKVKREVQGSAERRCGKDTVGWRRQRG